MSATAVLIAGVGIVLLLPLAWRIVQRRLDPLEPIVIFALAWGVMFVVRPAAILIREDTSFYGVDIGSTLDRAVLLGLVGAVAFVVGYEVSAGKRLAEGLRAPRDSFSSSAVIVGSLFVAALGLLALALVLLPSGGFHAIETFLSGRSTELNELIRDSTVYLWYGSLLVIPAALAGFAVAVTEKTPAAIGCAALLTGLALLRTVPTGNRVFMLVLLGGMVVFLFLRTHRRLSAAALLAGLAFALVLSNSLLIFRDPETRQSPSSIVSGLASTPSRVFAPLTRGADAEMAPALAGALLAVPSELPHRFGGATIGALVVRPVPRELWPGKPEPPTQLVTATVWPEARELGGFDPAFTPLLFFYWDFGLPGVFAGMAILGVIARSLNEYLRLHRDSVVVQLVFSAAFCYLVVAVRHDPVIVFVWAVLLFAPLVGIFGLASRGRGQAVAPIVGRRSPET